MNGSTGAIAADCDQAQITGSERGCGTGTAPSPWPLRTRLELAAQPTAPGVARGHVRAVAYEWGLASLADTAELLASEIATNAVLASQRLTARTDLAGRAGDTPLGQLGRRLHGHSRLGRQR